MKRIYITAWIVLISFFISHESDAAELFGGDVGGYVVGSLVGDALETVLVGVTIEWQNLTINVAHGIQKTQWRVPKEPDWQMDEWQGGTSAGIRIYPFNTETVRPLLVWTHVSDIMRGKPFNNDKNEPTSDFYGAGVTIVFKRLELDVAYGAFGRECHFTSCSEGSKTNEFQLTFRGYFWK